MRMTMEQIHEAADQKQTNKERTMTQSKACTICGIVSWEVNACMECFDKEALREDTTNAELLEALETIQRTIDSPGVINVTWLEHFVNEAIQKARES